MNEQNPILAELTPEQLIAELESRGVKVAPVAEKKTREKIEKVVLTDAEVLAKIAEAVAPDAEGAEVSDDLKGLREVLILKWRTTTAKQEAAKRPPYTGKKRGRKAASDADAAHDADAATEPADANPDAQ